MPADAWIPSHIDTADQPKFLALVDALEADDVAVLGALHFLWHWAARAADPDGVLPHASARHVARKCHWPGDPDGFVAALVAWEWLDDRPGEGYAVHNWPIRGGRYWADADAQAKRGAWAAHMRWHVQKDVVSADCQWCDGSQPAYAQPSDDAMHMPGAPALDTHMHAHSDASRVNDNEMPSRLRDTAAHATHVPTHMPAHYKEKNREERASRAHAWGVEQQSTGQPASTVAKRAMREWGPELSGVAMAAYREAAERGQQ